MSEAKKISCPSCGSDMRCEPKGLKCASCSFFQPIQKEPWEVVCTALIDTPVQSESVVYGCPNCGSAIETRDVSFFCPYCKSALIGEFLNLLEPQVMANFRVDKKGAWRALKKHIGSLWFAPNSFMKAYRRAGSMEPFLYPLWIFGTDVEVWYQGERGEYVWRNNKRKIHWTSVNGYLRLRLEDIQYSGLKNRPAFFAKFHWNRNDTAKLQMECLSGFTTKEYDLQAPRAFEYAKDLMKSKIVSAILRNIGGDVQRVVSYDARYENKEFGYMLVPIYIVAVVWRQKRFEFLINAQTAEVAGERPYSWIKILFFFLFVVASLVALYFLDQWLQKNYNFSLLEML